MRTESKYIIYRNYETYQQYITVDYPSGGYLCWTDGIDNAKKYDTYEEAYNNAKRFKSFFNKPFFIAELVRELNVVEVVDFDNEYEFIKRSALAKLTDEEKRVLGFE